MKPGWNTNPRVSPRFQPRFGQSCSFSPSPTKPEGRNEVCFRSLLPLTGQKIVAVLATVLMVFNSPALAEPAQSRHHKGSAEHRQYPPYPDVWGRLLSSKGTDNTAPVRRTWRLDNGDIQFSIATHLTKRWKPDGSIDVIAKYATLNFFGGQQTPISGATLESRLADLSWRKRALHFTRDQIQLPNGITIRHTTDPQASTNCFQPFRNRYQSILPNGVVQREIYFIFIHFRPTVGRLSPNCFRSARKRTVINYAGEVTIWMEPLLDGTFLAWPSNSSYIIRFGDKFRTPFNGITNLHIVDAEGLNKALRAAPDNLPQSRQDAVLQYMKQRSGAPRDDASQTDWPKRSR